LGSGKDMQIEISPKSAKVINKLYNNTKQRLELGDCVLEIGGFCSRM